MAPNLKMLVLSDLHSNYSIIEKIIRKVETDSVTVIIICGDITHFGNISQAKAIITKLSTNKAPLFFVPGNCDPRELMNVKSINSAENLHGNYIELDDIGLIGVGGSQFGPFHSPLELSESEIEKILRETRKKINRKKQFILISHVPPIKTAVDLTWSGIHAGSRAIREFVEKEKPVLVLCGHIHEARGTDTINGIPIVNAGPAYKLLCVIIDIGGSIKIRLDML